MTSHGCPRDPTATVREAEMLRLMLLSLADDLDALAERVRQAAANEQVLQAEEEAPHAD